MLNSVDGQVSYWLIVTILLISIVVGIIIDSFGKLRDFRTHVQKLSTSRCFVCGIERSVFERGANGFDDHIRRDHSSFAYLFLLLYLMEKPAEEHSGLETYVWRKLCEDDPSFFPRGSLCLERKKREAL